MQTGEWLGLIGSTLFAGWVTSFLVVDVIGFQINPPRNNGSIGFMGAALGQLIWLACNNKTSGLRGAVLGYVGFGLGMAGGRLLGNVANVLQYRYGFTINHWNVMETSCGFIGGFIYCFGMVDRTHPEPPERREHPARLVLRDRLRAGHHSALAPPEPHSVRERQNRRVEQATRILRLFRSRKAGERSRCG